MLSQISEPLIHTENISHFYGDRKAVDGLSFDVLPGEVVGLLGPNGSGKTTTVRMIMGALRYHSGELRVLGQPVATAGPKLRLRIGLVPQEDGLDPELNVEQNLMTYGRYLGLRGAELHSRVEEGIAYAELEDRRGQQLGELSGGMRRRLVLGRALMTHPKVLILDEPTTALDPVARRTVWEQVHTLANDRGIGVLLTTHFMDEAEYLCHRVIFVQHGRKVLAGTPQELIEARCRAEALEVHGGPQTVALAEEALARTSGDAPGKSVHEVCRHELTHLVVMTDDAEMTAAVIRAAVEGSQDRPLDRDFSILRRRSNLDDVYVLTAQGLSGGARLS